MVRFLRLFSARSWTLVILAGPFQISVICHSIKPDFAPLKWFQDTLHFWTTLDTFMLYLCHITHILHLIYEIMVYCKIPVALFQRDSISFWIDYPWAMGSWENDVSACEQASSTGDSAWMTKCFLYLYMVLFLRQTTSQSSAHHQAFAKAKYLLHLNIS